MFIVVMVANKPHRINLENILYYFEFAETGQAVFKLITGELFPTSTQIADVDRAIEEFKEQGIVIDFVKAILAAEGDSETPMPDTNIVSWAIKLKNELGQQTNKNP
jgi:hypothetical protein